MLRPAQVEMEMVNHKLMARTEDGWNRGKFGPIERFMQYFEPMEVMRARGARVQPYASHCFTFRSRAAHSFNLDSAREHITKHTPDSTPPSQRAHGRGEEAAGDRPAEERRALLS